VKTGARSAVAIKMEVFPPDGKFRNPAEIQGSWGYKLLNPESWGWKNGSEIAIQLSNYPRLQESKPK